MSSSRRRRSRRDDVVRLEPRRRATSCHGGASWCHDVAPDGRDDVAPDGRDDVARRAPTLQLVDVVESLDSSHVQSCFALVRNGEKRPRRLLDSARICASLLGFVHHPRVFGAWFGSERFAQLAYRLATGNPVEHFVREIVCD